MCAIEGRSTGSRRQRIASPGEETSDSDTVLTVFGDQPSNREHQTVSNAQRLRRRKRPAPQVGPF
jgi:hypothetical protein